MLEIKDLCVSYGAIDAVKGISLKVDDGEIVSLIGANGAGKTTTLHTITGLVPAKSGSITYDGHDLLKTHANKIVTLGMAHVPEGRHVFTRMSVQENLEMGAFSLKDQSNLGKDLEMVFDYFPRLKERRRQLAGTQGIRIPNSALCLEILRATGPLAASSANRSGDESAQTVDEAVEAFGNQIDLYLDGGPTQGHISSTVVKADPYARDGIEILREGVIPQSMIRKALHLNGGGLGA